MQVIKSKVNPNSPQFKENYQQMSELVGTLQENYKNCLNQGKEKHILRHKKAGKLLGRERVELLLDPDTPFLELMPLAGHGDNEATLGGSMIVGIGTVSGTECLILASVPTNKGGTINKASIKKSLRFETIASENDLPTIYFMESGGADLPQQSYIFNFGGATFREITRRSKRGIPSIAAVFGNCTAGGAYIPGMCDYVVMVKNQGKIFLAGPPLVKMATSEIVDDESLGGGEMHSRVSGVSDFLANDELDAIRVTRDIVETWNHSKKMPVPEVDVEEPLYDPDEILGIASAEVRIPYDVREVIARVVDGSRFSEFKPLYGPTLVTGFAKIHGMPIGIIANNGVLFSESSNKATQFIQLCNQSNTPLLFLQNITGFMVGRQYEEGGIVKNGAKLINAVATSGVPAITILTGASYGAGNYGMCGLAYQPRFLYTWPNSKIAVMGPDQLGGVMDIIQRDAAAKAGVPYDEKASEMMQSAIKKQIEIESNAYYATSQVWDDGIIDPRETRTVLALSLSAIYTSPFKGNSENGVFRM